jgi:hypothetical protein
MKKLNLFIFFITITLSLGACTKPNTNLQAAESNATNNNMKSEIITKNNLDVAKRFILKKGETCIWSNMYNNSPCFATAHYQFYLNPGPGGPYNHPQWNINCDPKKGDFNTLVVRNNNSPADSKIILEATDTEISFMGDNKVEIRPLSSNNTPSAKSIAATELAIKELLITIKNASRIKN